MLFQPHHIPLIQNGRKTQTRRTWDEMRVNLMSYQQIKTKIFTKEHFGYILINGYIRERLNAITHADAWAEGYSSVEEYLNEFHRIYPKAGKNPFVWVIEFKYVGKEKPL